MRKMIFCLCVALTGAIVASNSGQSVAREQDDKVTIKQVMQKGHKSGLLNKVKAGKASDDEAKQLLTFYKEMAKLTPPKGDIADWKTRCTGLVDGVQLYLDGKKAEAKTKLDESGNCMGCHSLHK